MEISEIELSKLKRLKSDPTAILDDDLVRLIVRETPKHLGGPISSMINGNERHFENTVRYQSLSAKCRLTRENAGISLKQLAAQLKIPQYRIRAIEEGSLSASRYADLNAYLAAIGLENWYKKWARANRSLARDLSQGKAGWNLLKKNPVMLTRADERVDSIGD